MLTRPRLTYASVRRSTQLSSAGSPVSAAAVCTAASRSSIGGWSTSDNSSSTAFPALRTHRVAVSRSLSQSRSPLRCCVRTPLGQVQPVLQRQNPFRP